MGHKTGVVSKINITKKLNHVQHTVQHATCRQRDSRTHTYTYTHKNVREIERFWCIIILIMFCTSVASFSFFPNVPLSPSVFNTTSHSLSRADMKVYKVLSCILGIFFCSLASHFLRFRKLFFFSRLPSRHRCTNAPTSLLHWRRAFVFFCFCTT